MSRLNSGLCFIILALPLLGFLKREAPLWHDTDLPGVGKQLPRVGNRKSQSLGLGLWRWAQGARWQAGPTRRRTAFQLKPSFPAFCFSTEATWEQCGLAFEGGLGKLPGTDHHSQGTWSPRLMTSEIFHRI